MACDFNPHHREGGDHIAAIFYVIISISIHTTAKVVTIIRDIRNRKHTISIHTTAKVVTRYYTRLEYHRFISIHTTAKVVTWDCL